MAVQIKELDGRRWGDADSSMSVERRFEIFGLAVAFTPSFTYSGIPNIGDAHPHFPKLIVRSRDFQEGNGRDKTRVVCTVKYSPSETETTGSGEEARVCTVDEWGWDEGTDERELVTDVDGVQVLNSVGDPFESVPNVSAPAPTFSKVMRFKDRQSGWFGYNCKVNSSEITIGGQTFPTGTLLCTVSEKRVIGDDVWKYQYSVHLKYRSNLVVVGGDSSVSEIGWDVAILDAGMRAKQTVGGQEKIMLIRKVDAETGKSCVVTSPALLNGNGYVRSETAEDEPYNIRFKAYARTSFPQWFYSEPTAQEESQS